MLLFQSKIPSPRSSISSLSDCWVSVYIPLSEISGWKWISRKPRRKGTFSFLCENFLSSPPSLHIRRRLYFIRKSFWNAKNRGRMRWVANGNHRTHCFNLAKKEKYLQIDFDERLKEFHMWIFWLFTRLSEVTDSTSFLQPAESWCRVAIYDKKIRVTNSYHNGYFESLLTFPEYLFILEFFRESYIS